MNVKSSLTDVSNLLFIAIAHDFPLTSSGLNIKCLRTYRIFIAYIPYIYFLEMKVETLNFLSFFKIIFSIVMFRDDDTTFDKEYRNRAPTRACINYTYVMNSVLLS